MDEIRRLAANKEADIICIQEPLVEHNKLACMPLNSVQIYNSSEAMAAVIILNSSITAVKLSQWTDDHLVVAEINQNGQNYLIVNQYCQFKDNIEIHMSKLERMSREINKEEK